MSQARNWILTIPRDSITVEDFLKKVAKYKWVGQIEEGSKTGYEHYQVCILNSSPIKFETLKNKFPKAHIERVRGTRLQAYEYVTKEESRIEELSGNIDPVELLDDTGSRTDLDEMREVLLAGATPEEVFMKYPSSARYVRYVEKLYESIIKTSTTGVMRTELEVLYVYGPSGSGKTRQVFEDYAIEDIYRVTDYQNPWDSYRAQKVLVLDEFSSSLKFTELLNILDIYPMELRSRYFNKYAAWEKVIIITNLPYHSQYPAIQEEHPEHYAALHRRIPTIRKFEKDGSYEDFPNLAC